MPFDLTPEDLSNVRHEIESVIEAGLNGSFSREFMDFLDCKLAMHESLGVAGMSGAPSSMVVRCRLAEMASIKVMCGSEQFLAQFIHQAFEQCRRYRTNLADQLTPLDEARDAGDSGD